MYLKTLFLFLCLSKLSHAQTPIISVSFYTFYEDLEIVQEVAKSQEMTKPVLSFLQGDNPTDQKIAVINVFSFGHKTALTDYERYLKRHHRNLSADFFDSLRFGSYPVEPTLETVRSIGLNADEFLCWAYLQALTDYIFPEYAHRGIHFATMLKPKNEAINYIKGLIYSRYVVRYKPCDVFLTMKAVSKGTYTSGKIRLNAKQAILDSLAPYSNQCHPDYYPNHITNAKGDTLVWIEKNYDGDLVKIKQDYFKTQGTSKQVNLVLDTAVSIEYDRNIDGSKVGFKVKNNGKHTSRKCIAILEDNKMDNLEEGQGRYYEILKAAIIPELDPGASIELNFLIHDFWLYNPNCEIRITIDYLDMIKELDETDNQETIDKWG